MTAGQKAVFKKKAAKENAKVKVATVKYFDFDKGASDLSLKLRVGPITCVSFTVHYLN